jgi:hypothetical protein
MGSRLTPVSLALGALTDDAAGLHGLASLLVLAAVVGAAAAAFGAVAATLAGHGSRLVAVTTGVALALLLVGSAVRFGAPVGEAPPTLALSTLVLAALCYAVPLVSWLLAPPTLRPRLRTEP